MPIDYKKLAEEQGGTVNYAALAAAHGADVPTPPTWADRALRVWPNVDDPRRVEAARAAIDVVEGAASGLAKTVYGGGDWIRRSLGNERIINDPRVQQHMAAPDSVAGKVGQTGEQLYEFVRSMGTAGSLTQGAPLLARMGAEAATAGTLSAAQSGGDPSAIKMGTIMGAVGPLLGAGVRLAYRSADETLDAFLARNPHMTPNLRKAIDYARAHGIPLTMGQQTGNENLITTEQQLPSQFGSSQIAQKANRLQEDALVTEAQTAANRINQTTAAQPVEAAEDLNRRLVNRINESKDWVSKRYEQVRSIVKADRNAKQMVVGQKPSAVLDPYGNPYTTDIVAAFETPIDISARQATLRPLYEEINRMMPIAQKEISPGFTALREIVEGKSVMNAETLDQNLGAIKALIRRQGRDYLPTRSQGVARQVVSELEKDIEAAYSKAGGRALEKLKQARTGVRDYHEVGEILASLPEEPGQLYARLIQGGDKRINLLRDLKQFAPNEVKQIGNTFIQGLVEKLTQGGQIGRARGVIADFNRLGPETKQILFGNPEQVAEFQRFLTTVEELGRLRNPSGSAASIASLGSIGNIFKGARNMGLAKVLMEPGGPALIRTMLVAPQGSGLYNSAIFQAQKLATPDSTTPVPAGLQ